MFQTAHSFCHLKQTEQPFLCLLFVQACFLGFECAMKFLNWLAPDLWWQLSENVNPRTRTLEHSRVIGSTNTQNQTAPRDFSTFLPMWLILKPRGTFWARGSFRADVRWRLWTCTGAHSFTHRRSNVLTPLCFTCFLICLCQVILFYLWEKEWPEHACLTFCYLRAGAHIREKVHFVVLCVFDLSTAHAFQTVCCFLSGHSNLCLNEILREIMSWIEHFMNISLYRNV